VGKSKDPTYYGAVFDERHQTATTRRDLISEIGEALDNRCVLVFYTSFVHDVLISDGDVAIIEDALMGSDLSRGLVLIVNSPGGFSLSAERIINVCRAHSSGGFDIIVPKQAKSAATLMCFGASKIYMSPTSELGPVDPQVPLNVGERLHLISAFGLVAAYRDLLAQAVACRAPDRIEPYLQQLDRFDARLIADYEREIELSKKISVEALKTGMMAGVEETEIERRIQLFLNPAQSGSHGRPITRETAQKCGLEIEGIDLDAALWHSVMELHVRASEYVNGPSVAKIVETAEYDYAAIAPQM
jgi:hypothetical protein